MATFFNEFFGITTDQLDAHVVVIDARNDNKPSGSKAA